MGMGVAMQSSDQRIHSAMEEEQQFSTLVILVSIVFKLNRFFNQIVNVYDQCFE